MNKRAHTREILCHTRVQLNTLKPSTPIHPWAATRRVLDTNGAGDAFNAGFLRVWALGKGVEAALHVGCASAALAVQHTGKGQVSSS